MHRHRSTAAFDPSRPWRPAREPGPAALAGPAGSVLGDAEFALFQRWIHQVAGITMGPAKALVAGRLARRVAQHGLASFEAYFELLQRDPQEHQLAVDLLTTNETTSSASRGISS
jgi:hypothetical protein